jgi:hypothetical protein
MTIPVSVRVDAIAERFHIDCHMFCILLDQDPKAVSDSALECFGRGNNLLWPTGGPSLIIRSMPLATSCHLQFIRSAVHLEADFAFTSFSNPPFLQFIRSANALLPLR